jgi:Uma2 family endonuclease
MQPETSNTRWTFARMVAELPAESRYELHEGVLLDMSPSPSSFHQDILLNLSFIFRTYLQKTLEGKAFIAPLDVVLADYEVVQPDLFVLVGEPRQRIDTPFRGVPDLVVEILSPANIRRDKVEKRALYAQFGVKEYWIIDPDMQAVEVLRLEGGAFLPFSQASIEGTVVSALFQGLVVDLEDVFA